MGTEIANTTQEKTFTVSGHSDPIPIFENSKIIIVSLVRDFMPSGDIGVRTDFASISERLRIAEQDLEMTSVTPTAISKRTKPQKLA